MSSFIIQHHLEEWRKKTYDARNEYIDGLIAQGQAELDAAETSRFACKLVLKAAEESGDAMRILAAQIELDAANELVKQILDNVNRLEAMKNNITYSGDKSATDITKQLQDTIDYYNNIISAVEIMRDKYKDAIDSEIDALEDAKDALKETNDERQRELDLIEARTNLENAKKRKVYTYTEGDGFNEVRNEKAVKEAEEKYREVITDIQEAEIDKQIAQLEKQKEALDENTKALTELPQKLQDALIVQQALADLGITNPDDLLTLPESVKKDIANKLAEAMTKKQNEENKDTDHKELTLSDVLKEAGSKKDVNDLDPAILDNVTQAAYNNVIEGFNKALGELTDSIINNTTNNTVNNPVINQNIVINDATDPEKVGEAVGKYVKDMLTQYCNYVR